MMAVVVKGADLNRIDVPEDHKILDATALGRRWGFKRESVGQNHKTTTLR